MVFGITQFKAKLHQLSTTIKNMGGHFFKSDEKKDDKKIKEHWDDKEIKSKLSIPTPPKVENMIISEDATVFEKSVFITKSVQKSDEAPTAETPDIVLNSDSKIPPKKTTYPQPHEDGWSFAYYPAGGSTGKRPNIDAIRTWVENTKVGNASNWSLSEEFGESFGFIGWGFTPEEKKKKIDEVAYKVARKIWYVGRKPSSMTDNEWNEETKHMRPPEGSFNYRGEEKWNNFPYDETYMYRSGYIQ